MLHEESSSDSRDCVNFICTRRGDTTVRPLRPMLRALALAKREKLARWQEQAKQQTDTGDITEDR